MRVYKLTRPDLTTYGGFQYVKGKTYRFSGQGALCGPGWSHAYLSPELAVLLNPIHANYSPAVLWECEATVGKRDHQLKVGCTRIRLVRPVPMPEATTEQRITFAIWCALAVYTAPLFIAWAESWLSGSDRSWTAADAAAYAARAAAAAAYAAAAAAAYAAADAAAYAAAARLDLIATAAQALRVSA